MYQVLPLPHLFAFWPFALRHVEHYITSRKDIWSRMKATKLLLVESRSAVSFGIRLLLNAEADLCLVGEVSDCQTALAMLQSLAPDIVIVDIDGPNLDRSMMTGSLQQISKYALIILLSLLDEPATHRLAGQVGATGLVFKSMPPVTLLKAIRQGVNPASATGAIYEPGDVSP